MEFGPSDSSGTDDDLPPMPRGRSGRDGVTRGSGNGSIPMMGSHPYSRMRQDMESQIHHLEQEAYCSILMAFKAQSDVITWEQESLITELRKELRVTDEDHRELLSRVNTNDIIRRIRDWRKNGAAQNEIPNNPQVSHPAGPSPSPSISRKKQKPPPLPLPLPPPQPSRGAAAADVAPPSSKRATVPVPARSKKHKMPVSGSVAKPTQYIPAESAAFNPLIGRKVLTRWPDDNNFYEAVITDYNPTEGLHALVYDINTKNETWEWVNLNEISPEDIRWEGEDPGIPPRQNGPPRSKKPAARTAPPGRGRGPIKAHNFSGPQNGVGNKRSEVIEILHTETLIKAVEKVISASNPDPVEIEKAKRALKGHEQSLIEAIARIADASDTESGN